MHMCMCIYIHAAAVVLCSSSVLQYVVVYPDVLQCIAEYSRSNHMLLQGVLQCVAVCCSVLQRVAVCCSVLPCVAVCCRMMQNVAECCSIF